MWNITSIIGNENPHFFVALKKNEAHQCHRLLYNKVANDYYKYYNILVIISFSSGCSTSTRDKTEAQGLHYFLTLNMRPLGCKSSEILY